MQALGAKAHEDAVLLLGVHLESINGYFPMFTSEGKPQTDVRPGYRTVVMKTHAGGVELVGDLPYLSIPQRDGFLFVGEASVSVHLPDDPRVTLYDGSPKPRNYDATSLWKTSNAAQINASQSKLLAELKRNQAWGVERTEQIIYATRSSLCTTYTESEVTGGALYFHASSSLRFSGLGAARVSDKMTDYLADERFRLFGSGLLGIAPEDIDFDRPIVHNSFDLIVWRDDVMACLAHDKGALMLTGSVRVSANSARRYLLTRAEGPAPESIAPGHGAIEFAPVRAAIPGAVDAYVSPARDVLLVEVVEEDKPVKMVTWDVLGKRMGAELPPLGRPVLDEWATGETAERWLRELGPRLRRPAKSPSSKERP